MHVERKCGVCPLTHRSLDHLHALVPHLVDGSCNVHHLLLLDLLQDIVNTDEGAGTTHTSTVEGKKWLYQKI